MRSRTPVSIKILRRNRASMKFLILVGIILVTALVLYHMRMGRVFPAQVILTGESIPDECENKTYVADRAEYIVEGIVEKAIVEEGIRPPTYIIKVESSIKGDIKEKEIQLVDQDCSYGFFEEGEKVRIYFEKRNGEFVITCGVFGIEDKFPPFRVIESYTVTKECENKTYVADRAEYIVEGIVEKIIAIFPRGRKSPTYYYIIEIESSIKGDIKEGKIQLVGGLHKFLEEGEKVKIYFEERNGKFFTTCGGFGIEKKPKG
jgi:hypothetical protein